MAELMLVNPRKRRRRRKTSARRKRRRSPRAKTRTIKIYAKNPSRRRKRRVTRYRRNPSRRRLLPSISGVRGMVNRVVAPALPAAAGAVLLDAAWANLPIPANLKTGPVRHLAKGAGAIGLGLIAERVVNRSTAQSFAVGAMTVVLYGAFKEMMARFLPAVRLDAYWYDDYPALRGMGYVNSGQVMNGLGVYMDPSTGLPATDPSRMVGDDMFAASCAPMNPQAAPVTMGMGMGMYTDGEDQPGYF